jgi:HD-GYP domain-containing protein (c-di-GMP phosphodiesterase class II)
MNARLSELLGVFAVAGDLGRGQQVGHVFRSCVIAMSVARHMALPPAQQKDVYFTCLLMHSGCTAGAAQIATFLMADELSAQRDICLCDPDSVAQVMGWLWRHNRPGSALPARLWRFVQAVTQAEQSLAEVETGCSDVGARIAERLGLSQGTRDSLYHICERWNGKGPHKLKAGAVPLPARIVNTSMIAEVFYSSSGAEAARAAVRRRSGKSLDPAVADAFLAVSQSPELTSALQQADGWSDVCALEPGDSRVMVPDSEYDTFFLALADFSDLKLPHAPGHSRAVAALAERVARRAGMSETDVTLARRAALVHTLGHVAVPAILLEADRPLTAAETEKVRLHPYFTERLLSHAPSVSEAGRVAAMHHERPDGAGYPHGLKGSQMPDAAKALAVADAFQEMVEGGHGRAPLPQSGALQAIQAGAGAQFDEKCARALAEEFGARPAAASPPPRQDWPASLTTREVEVLRLVARGNTVGEAAKQLVISESTARHHLEHIYTKIGVSSRAGAVVFAVENRLLPEM